MKIRIASREHEGLPLAMSLLLDESVECVYYSPARVERVEELTYARSPRRQDGEVLMLCGNGWRDDMCDEKAYGWSPLANRFAQQEQWTMPPGLALTWWQASGEAMTPLLLKTLARVMPHDFGAAVTFAGFAACPLPEEFQPVLAALVGNIATEYQGPVLLSSTGVALGFRAESMAILEAAHGLPRLLMAEPRPTPAYVGGTLVTLPPWPFGLPTEGITVAPEPEALKHTWFLDASGSLDGLCCGAKTGLVALVSASGATMNAVRSRIERTVRRNFPMDVQVRFDLPDMERGLQ